MELIDQRTKAIMEGCKERARAAGLSFSDQTLEYIVTNRDLLEISPKAMIPTLYDYWVQDVDVLKEKGKYELYPSNPYETVINTRPAISFYNDNNPDWLNVMIFYHVLAHIDFFQNNIYFRHTWDYDFTGRALSDKRMISQLRAEKGRFVDYVIEFSRGIDNLVGYFNTLSDLFRSPEQSRRSRLDYYFDVFLQKEKNATVTEYIKEVERYNDAFRTRGEEGEAVFFVKIDRDHPEFDAAYRSFLEAPSAKKRDLMQYLMDESTFLNRPENRWMKSIMQVVRTTSLFFQPQIRTKIMNEGWASYWHETLFLQDERITGREIDFAKVNAGVTAMPRAGLNPYALGMRLFYFIESEADKGRLAFEYERLQNARRRDDYDRRTGTGKDMIFQVRERLSDFTFLSRFVNQDFVTKNKLFVVGKRLNPDKMVWEYYVKSRSARAYREMLFENLYHPPYIEIDLEKSQDGELHLVHHFEEKPLVTEYISNTLLGIEYLWGKPVHLETSEIVPPKSEGRRLRFAPAMGILSEYEPDDTVVLWRRVLYTMKDRKLSKKAL